MIHMDKSRLRQVLKWCSSSLGGFTVLLLILVSLPEFSYFMVSYYLEGTLSISWAIYMAVVCAIEAIVIAITVWYFVLLPRIRNKIKHR
jgi:hypothetical protein